MSKRPKRPRAPAQLAKLLVDIATGQLPNDSFTEEEKKEIEKTIKTNGLNLSKDKNRKIKLNKESFLIYDPERENPTNTMQEETSSEF